ncbi:MAG: hypothetical protein JWM57_3754 [Phycisphaerales bacterium]|nr:hypothetical protein [Phycisphaerales bacterium]
MKIKNILTISISIFAAASTVMAHGPVVQISVENNKIVTRGLVFDTANYGDVNPVQYSYVVPLVQRSLGDANDGWYAQFNSTNSEAAYLGPGIKYGSAGFNSGVTITETIADGLKLWDGTSFTDPGNEQVQGLRGSIGAPSATLASMDGGVGGSFSLTTPATITATSHSQVYWRLLGDGLTSASASDDGVYLLTLKLTTSQAGVAASAPYYLLLSKNASAEAQAAGQNFVNTTLVPEPAFAGVAAMLSTGLLGRRRRA